MDMESGTDEEVVGEAGMEGRQKKMARRKVRFSIYRNRELDPSEKFLGVSVKFLGVSVKFLGVSEK